MRIFIIIGLLFVCIVRTGWALNERHLIVIRSGEAQHHLSRMHNSNPNHPHYKPTTLTTKGQEEVNKAAQMLLSYGFDNRNIVAIYVSPLPRALETAQIMANIGIFSKEKIHVDQRLIDQLAGDREGKVKTSNSQDLWWVSEQEAKASGGESNTDVRRRMLSLYDEIEKQYPQGGHVLFITHGVPAMELIDGLTKSKVKLTNAQAYLVPLIPRSKLS